MAKGDMIIRLALKGATGVHAGLKKLGGAVSTLGARAKDVAKTFAKIGVGMSIPMALALREASKFGDKLREIQSISKNMTEGEVKELGRELRAVSGAFGQDIGKVAKAQYDLVSAGVENASSALRESARLAVAGVADISETADLLSTSMNAYTFTTYDAEQASNILFGTVKQGKTTVSELSSSLGQVLPFANTAKLGLAGVGSAMATLTASGIDTARASTSLRQALVVLSNPVGELKKQIASGALEIHEFSDGSMDLVTTMEQFKNMDAETIAKMIPNIEARTAIDTLRNSVGKLRENYRELANTGDLVGGAVNTMNNSFGQQARMLKENLKSGAIEFGTAIAEFLMPHIKGLNENLALVGDIGWDVVAGRIKDNIIPIFTALSETIALLLGRVWGAFTEKVQPVMEWMVKMVMGVFGILTEDIRKAWKMLWLSLKFIVSAVVDTMLSPIYLIIDAINLVRRALGEPLIEYKMLMTGVAEEMNETLNTSTKVSDLFATGFESGKATGEELKNIWSGLMNTILAKNDEVKDSNNEVDEKAKAGTEGVIETKTRLGIVTGELAKIEANSYATSLSGLRSTISGYLAQAVAKALNFEAAKGLAGLVTGSLVAIGMTKLFDTFIPKFAMGGEMMVDKPQLFLAGEAGRERVTVEREDGRGFQSGKNVQVNISAPLVDETVRDSILPAIQKAIRNELA